MGRRGPMGVDMVMLVSKLQQATTDDDDGNENNEFCYVTVTKDSNISW